MRVKQTTVWRVAAVTGLATMPLIAVYVMTTQGTTRLATGARCARPRVVLGLMNPAAAAVGASKVAARVILDGRSMPLPVMCPTVPERRIATEMEIVTPVVWCLSVPVIKGGWVMNVSIRV